MRKTSQKVQDQEERVDTNGILMVDSAEGQFLYPYEEGGSIHSKCKRRKAG